MLVSATLVLPWWSWSAPAVSETDNWYLFQICTEEFGKPTGCRLFLGSPYGMGPTLEAALAYMVAAIVLAVIDAVSFALAISRPRLRHVCLPVGLVASSLAVIAPVYLFFNLPVGTPGTPTTGFFGSTTFASWGGGPGWYLAFVAAVVLSGSTLVGSSVLARRALAEGADAVSAQGAEAQSTPSLGESAQTVGRTNRTFLILLIAGVALAGVASLLPWWYLSVTAPTASSFAPLQGEGDWHLGGICTGPPCAMLPSDAEIGSVYGLTTGLVLAGLALSLCPVIVLVKSPNRPRWVTASPVAGILGGGLILAGAVEFYLALPGTYLASRTLNGFSGSYFPAHSTISNFVTMTWGGGLGWILALVAGPMIIGSTLAAVEGHRARQANPSG